MSQLGFAATFNVTTQAQLRTAITTINAAPGTTPLAIANQININVASITITATDLEVLRNGATITSTVGGSTISGASGGVPAFRLFATSKSDLTLENLILDKGLAKGGDGSSSPPNNGGGGGGMGAGGGVYIDLGRTLTLTNTTIQNCIAQGGNGASSSASVGTFYGKGGGASFTTSKNASTVAGNNTSGGDNPAIGVTGGTSYQGATGYGGGNANAIFGFTGGTGGGDGQGPAPTLPNGGNGGYCGGGGGSGNSDGAGGGGGGNGGRNGSTSAGGINAGGGGGFGSGGASGDDNSGNAAGGGGGGFGGGGGSTRRTFCAAGAGGFGGGGGGSGGNGSSGGAYGGAGSGAAGPGGGGAGIGGAVFVGDTAILVLNNAAAIPANSNSTAGGSGANPGIPYANDIFLFKKAQVQFRGSANLTVPFAIQGDVDFATVAANQDSGVLIQTSLNSNVITFTGTTSNYQGGTTITTGTLSVGTTGNIPTTGPITIGASGILTLTGSPSLTGAMNNAGGINIGGAYTPPSSFTNTGGLFVVSGGSITTALNCGGSLNIGQTALGVASSNAFSAAGTITIPTINVYNGSFANNGFAVTGVNTAFTIASGASATLTAGFSGTATAGSSSNSGTLTINSGGAFSLTGFTNNSAGIITINSGGTFTKPTTFTNTGTTNLNGTGNISGAFTGGSGSILNIGPVLANNFSTSGNITGVVLTTINSGSSLTLNNTMSGGTTDNLSGGTLTFASGANNANSVTNNSGGIFYISGASTNTGAISNSGGMTVSAALSGAGTITNTSTGTLTFASGASNANAITNNLSGVFNISGASSNSAIITNNGTMSITSDFTNTGTIDNHHNLSISANVPGVGTIMTDSINSLTFSGTVDMSGQTLSSTGTVTLNSPSTVTVDSYTNSYAHNTTITDASTFGQLSATGVVDLTGSTINVTSSTIDNGTWTIISGASLTYPSPQINLPTSTIFDSWAYNVTNTQVDISHQYLTFAFLATGAFNIEVAGVLDNMANNIINAGQQALIDLFRASPNQQQLNNNLHQMMQIANSLQLDLEMQNTVYNKVEARIASAARPTRIAGLSNGINVGDLTPDSFMWLSASGSLTNQSPIDLNDGYNAKTGVFLLGIDSVKCDQVVGAAVGYSISRINELSNAGFFTNTQRYHGLFFGTYNGANDNYVDWTFTGSYNNNNSHRAITVNGSNLSTSASFDSFQFGAKATKGKAYDFWDSYLFTPLTYVQYSYLNQSSYNESGGSIAALHVAEDVQNVVTLGLGAKFAFPIDAWQIIGMRELRASVSYDVLHPQNITTANFLVGSETFDVFSTPERISYKLGAGMTFEFAKHILAEINYDFEFRSGFTDHTLLAKVKYVF